MKPTMSKGIRNTAMSKASDIAKLFANLPGVDIATKVNKHITNRNTVQEIVDSELKGAIGKQETKK
jgi:hypothetical protein